MNVLITGGSGFLGHRLARQLLDDGLEGRPIGHLMLADRVAGPALDDRRVELALGDTCDRDFLTPLVAKAQVIYHLAAVVSSEAESNFDLGLRVNIDGARQLLDLCRSAGTTPRVVFTSSVAVFGPDTATGGIISDTGVDPRSSYGMEKAVVELLVAEYSRRGFVDGLTLRLPTISVRPGRPNKAASSFVSSIVREPLSGSEAVCPVSHDTALWLLSPRYAVRALLKAGTIDTGALAPKRTINLPGLSATVGEILSALEMLGGRQARELVRDVPDPAIERIVASWPAQWDHREASALGFEADKSIKELIGSYIADDLAP